MSFAVRRTWGEVISPPGPTPPPPAEVTLIDGNFDSLAFEPATASFSYTLFSDGSLLGSASLGSQSYDWLSGSGAASDYDVRWTTAPGSDDPDTGAVNTWLNLGTNRSWTIEKTGSGGQFYEATVQIRNSSTGTVLASAELSIFLEVISEIPQ
jgi:hypothetical protein